MHMRHRFAIALFPGAPKPGTDAFAAMEAWGVFHCKGTWDWSAMGTIGREVLAGRGDGTVSREWANVFVLWEQGELGENDEDSSPRDRRWAEAKADRAYNKIKAEIVRILGEHAVY